MDKKQIFDHLRPLLGQKLEYGVNDCNLVFLELFYPEMADAIRGRYKTERGGFSVAKREFGYANVGQLLDDYDEWEEIDNSFASFGDVLFRIKSVSICLGDKTFSFDADGFKLISTNRLVGTLYRKVK